jgi:hypothetical protein
VKLRLFVYLFSKLGMAGRTHKTSDFRDLSSGAHVVYISFQKVGGLGGLARKVPQVARQRAGSTVVVQIEHLDPGKAL